VQIHACATENRPQIINASIQLGFLTGSEPKVMLEAHTQAALVIGVPFQKPGPFDFCTSNMPKQVIDLGPTMLKHRRTPPPEEGYSLHRKLSGSFLACKKIGAVVRCREMFMQVYNNYKFSNNNGFDHKRTAGYRV
jgi:aarF domain-containing kinase